MRYMVMHYQTQEMEDGILPSPEQQAAIGEYMQEAAMSGVLLAGEGVASSSQGARVEVNDGKVRVIDGPFAEAKELIAGFAILEVDSLAEAVEHARKFALLVGTERVDVRRVIEFEDLQGRATDRHSRLTAERPRARPAVGDAVAGRVTACDRPADASGRRPRHRRGARPGRLRRGDREVAAGRRTRQPGGVAEHDGAVPRRRPDPPPRHPARQVPAGGRLAASRHWSPTSTRSSTATWPTTCSG